MPRNSATQAEQPTMSRVITLLGILSTFTLLVSFFILYKLTNVKNISIPLTLTLIVSLFLPLSTTYLLPIDVATSDDSSLTSLLWRLNYWITFFLTWLILPFWQYFLSCGEFTVWNRIRSSAISVFRFLLFLIILGVLLLFYLILYHRDVLHFQYLKSLLITSSHVYSLTMAIWLMVHGLTHLPKHFYMTSYSKQLNDNYMKLPQLQMRLEDSKFDLRDICNKVFTLNSLLNQQRINDVFLRDHILYMFDKIPQDFKNSLNISNISDSHFLVDSLDISIDKIDNKYLSSLNENLKLKFWDYQHCKSTFEDSIMEIVYLEDIINYLNNSSFSNSALDVEWRNFRIKWPRWMFNYFWPLVNLLVFFVFSIIAFIIIESEMLHSTRFSILSWIISPNMKFSYILMSLFLIIMMSCSLKSLSLVKLFNIYQVEFNSNSDPVSSIFFISYALRLTIPLGYNFLMLLNYDFVSSSSFLSFVSGNLELIKAGEFLNDLIPRLVLIPMLMSVFGVWGKLRRWLDGYFLFDYFIDEMEIDARDESNDLEAVVGSTNKIESLIQNGRTITQSAISNGSIPLNDSLPRFNSAITQDSTLDKIFTIVSFPIRLQVTVISRLMAKISSFFHRDRNVLDLESDHAVDGLRHYNLTTSSDGILLESRRNSDISDYSGVSGLSGGSSIAYDADNRVLGDDFIRNIK